MRRYGEQTGENLTGERGERRCSLAGGNVMIRTLGTMEFKAGMKELAGPQSASGGVALPLKLGLMA